MVLTKNKMFATLKKIDPERKSQNGNTYIRIYLELESGGFVMTDLCEGFRNFRRWEPVLFAGRGTKIEGVCLIGPTKVDADSKIRIIQEPLPEQNRFLIESLK